MAVSALELRPRSPVALFDAAIRLVARQGGLWSLALPGGALVTGALLHLRDAAEHRQPLALPALLLTLAWFARGLFQGAACHHLERTLLAKDAPTPLGSLKAALGRAPSLFITVALVGLFQVLSVTVTLGIVFLFYGAHLAAYAVTMQGLGAPVKVLGTTSTLLGGAKRSAVQLRWLFSVQALVILNLHIAALVALAFGRSLLGLDLTFAARFTSLDNGSWWLVICCLGFTLFEPLRAAVAVLLVLDGRVRQEGLDLLAAIEHLPRRERKKPRASAALGLALALGLLAGAPSARAQAPDEPAPPDPAAPGGNLSVQPLPLEEISTRLQDAARACRGNDPALRKKLQATRELSAREQAALSRFLQQVESTIYDEDDCELGLSQLRAGAAQISAARDALASRPSSATASERAQEILRRPEFRVIPEKDAVEEPPKEEEVPEEGWWSRFWRRLGKWLKRLLERDESASPTPLAVPVGAGAGAGLANLLVVLLVAAVVGLLAWLLLRGREQRGADGDGAQSITVTREAGAPDPQNALSRPPEGWAELADQLAARGEYREAVRSLYLALLSRLHRDGTIDYDPTLSNWDYFRHFKRRAQLAAFRELTFRFDFTYYGNLGADAPGYAAFRQLSLPFLAPAAPSPEEAASA